MTNRQGLEWKLGGKTIDCSRPCVIAIVNVTPDSFYSASRFGSGPGVKQALQTLLAQGPDAIDIGGQSSRPGSDRIAAEKEIARIIPVIERLRDLAPKIPITADTYWGAVARAALAAGADGVNDISAGRLDPELLEVVAESGCGYVLMHMQGTPETMQQQPHYENCLHDVSSFFSAELERLERLGIQREAVALDPGIGFGKRLEDNLALIKRVDELASLSRPMLYGVSRKSFISQVTGAKDPAERLPGTLGVTWELLNRGVMLHRVHDPGPVRQLCQMWTAINDTA